MLIPITNKWKKGGWACKGFPRELLCSHPKQFSKHSSLAERLTAAYRTHTDYSSLCVSMYESTVRASSISLQGLTKPGEKINNSKKSPPLSLSYQSLWSFMTACTFNHSHSAAHKNPCIPYSLPGLSKTSFLHIKPYIFYWAHPITTSSCWLNKIHMIFGVRHHLLYLIMFGCFNLPLEHSNMKTVMQSAH